MIRKYIKRPVTIEAVQYTGDNAEEIMSFVEKHLFIYYRRRSYHYSYSRR